MILKENTSRQKLRGAYYTPLTLAEKIVTYYKGDTSIRTVLEPSCGDGVFFDALIKQNLIELRASIVLRLLMKMNQQY